MLTLTITATTTTDEIEASIPFLDMREHAIELRDTAAAVLAEQGDQEVLELHEIGNVTVLFSPTFGYAYVNEMSGGVGNSLLLDNGTVDRADHAAVMWTHGADNSKDPIYHIELSSDTDEVEQFAAWLTDRGHDVVLGRSTGSYVNGAWTSRDVEANEVLNALWSKYCDS